MDPITLYGAPFSLYTGRARSYLIKAGIDYREEPHASAHFFESVLPKAGGRRDMRDLLDLRLSRAIGRHDNLEVWL